MIAPNAAIGTASKTANGTDQLSYKAERNKKTNNKDNPKIAKVLLPAFISSLLNPENS